MICGRTYTENSRALADKKSLAREIFLTKHSLQEVCSELGISRKAALSWLRGTIDEFVRHRLSETKNVGDVVQETGIPLSFIKKMEGIDSLYFTDITLPKQPELIEKSFYTDSPACPHCDNKTGQIKHGFTRAKRQRYFCKYCGRTYTPKGWRSRYSEKVKRSSVQKYQQEKRARLVSSEMGISQPSLSRWFDDYANQGQNPALRNLRVYQKINRTKPSKKSSK